MSKTKKVPNLRFQGFTDDWEQRKLGDVATFSKGTGYSKKDLESDGTPIILYGRMYTNYELVIHSVDTFTIPKEKSIYSNGGEVIVPASGETAEDISVASVVKQANVLLGGDLNIIYANKNIEPVFLALSITNGEPHKDMAKRAQGKSVVHLHNSDLAQIKLSYPSKDEQKKIDSYFLKFDSLIALHQHKLDQLRVLKEILLQKLFANDQHDKPELRFKDFTDKWEKVKIGSLFTESTEKSATGQLLSVSINKGVYPFDETERKNNSSKNKSNYKFVEKYDIAYNSMRMWQGAEGVSYYSGIVSPAYTVLKPQQNSNPEFYAYMFKRAEMLNKFRRYSQGLTSDTWNLKFPILKTISLRTTDIKEQEKIVQLLRMVKDNISLQQKKLTQYQQAKKFLLQQMFI